MEQLNTLSPNIEPRATGHIIDQIEMVKKLLIMALLMLSMVRYILMLKNIIKNIITVNYQGETLNP